MKNSAYNELFNTTLLCIDSYDNKIMKGRAYNPAFEGGIVFNSTMELLTRMEKMLDETQQPQSFSDKRTFWTVEAKPEVEHSDNTNKTGKLATFALRIVFRQNSSWQGTIVWYNAKKEERFRSVLELLLLIDSALSADNTEK